MMRLGFLYLLPCLLGLNGAFAQIAEASPTMQSVPPPETTDQGWSSLVLGLGVGPSYAGFGAQAAYPWTVWSEWPLQVAPFVATGVWPGEEEARDQVALAAGAQAIYGRSHRAFLQLGYAPVGAARWALHGVVVVHELLYGMDAIAGYEYLAESNFLCRIGVGVGAPFHHYGATNNAFSVSFALGAGWRLW